MPAAKTCFMVVLAFHALALPVSAEQSGSTEMTHQEVRFFEEKIRPLLIHKCHGCHGARKQKSDLRLDSQAGIIQGGASGAVIEIGKPDASLLIDAVEYNGLEMPPDEQLPQQDIKNLRLWIQNGAKWPASPIAATRDPAPHFTSKERQFWSFQPVTKTKPPGIRGRGTNPVDRFIFAKLKKQGLQIAPPARPDRLIRRLYLDLTGLIPPIEVVDAFTADPSEKHYQQIVDMLLESPRHGERWARFWLDLVRYSESDGYNSDDYRENAWHYRDYVIDAFNHDKPYDQFIREQIAGDELDPDNQQALIATGYLRHWIYEYNQRDAKTQWAIILNDITDVTGDAILGLGMSCARCHDHKFDPILRKDYYRLQAFFSPLLPRDIKLTGTDQQQSVYQAELQKWETASADIRQQITNMQASKIKETTVSQIEKFPLDVRPALYKNPEQRTPYEKQLAYLAFRQVEFQINRLDWSKHFMGDELQNWKTLTQQLKDLEDLKPKPLGTISAVTDIDSHAPLTFVPDSQQQLKPGGLSLLDPRETPIIAPPGKTTTGRRSALAKWLTHPQNPLISRVMANRIWQHHFGHGLVNTPSDFGTLGSRPSHPKLLDYLADTFMENNWSIKHLHRLIVTSETYRQSAIHPAAERARLLDSGNQLLWRANIRRFDAEQLRDNLLAAGGELDLQLPGEGQAADSKCRSIYLRMIRNQPNPLLLTFDASDGILSTPERHTTTTPTQALFIMNNPWVLARAVALGVSTMPQDLTSFDKDIDLLHRRLYSRSATVAEIKIAHEFLNSFDSLETGWTDYCHILLAANEFLYIQ